MAVVHAPESAYAKEAVKWEMYHSQYGPPGRPFVQQEYPKMLHMGGHDPATGRRAITNHVVVGSAMEEAEQIARGFFVRQEDAMARVEAQDLEIAQAAAEENYRITRMSEKAQREANAVLAEAGEHLATIPETPIRRKPGRPAKAVPATAQE